MSTLASHKLSAKQNLLLRELATRELARRARSENTNTASRQSSEEDDAQNLETTFIQQNRSATSDDGVQLENLVIALKEARSRNDDDWAVVREDLARLEKRPPDELDAALGFTNRESSRYSKEVELATTEYEIRRLEDSLNELPPAQTTLEMDVITRARVADSIEELETALHVLREEETAERHVLEMEEMTLDDLKQVLKGLHKRKEKVDVENRDADADTMITKLRGRVEKLENRVQATMSNLIAVISVIRHPEADADGWRMRNLMDSLMNRAWDSPADPFVDVSGYSQALAAFLVRANIAVEHPSDARKLRLISFTKPMSG